MITNSAAMVAATLVLIMPVGVRAIIYNGHEYLLTSTEMTWPDAEAEAVTRGGHLVTLNNDEEFQFVLDNFEKDPYQQFPMWIGLNDIASEGNFVWSSGETASAEFMWHWPEPDNGDWGVPLGPEGADAVALVRSGHGSSWVYEDKPWDLHYRGLIERGVPDKSNTAALLVGAVSGLWFLGRWCGSARLCRGVRGKTDPLLRGLSTH
jgi:hypothetical protein